MFLFLTSKIKRYSRKHLVEFFSPLLLLYDFFSAVVAKPPAHPSPSKKRVRLCKPCAKDYFFNSEHTEGRILDKTVSFVRESEA